MSCAVEQQPILSGESLPSAHPRLQPKDILRNKYYKACFEAGVERNDAVNGEAETKQKFMEWWKGDRFTKSRPALIIDDDDTDETSMSEIEYTNEDQDDDSEVVMHLQYPYFSPQEPDLKSVKTSLISILKEDQDIKPQDNPRFLSLLKILESQYGKKKIDARYENDCNDATWFTFVSSGFQESLGRNKDGDHKYTLGRMSFDMFKPTNLVCSIQWTFNTVISLHGQNTRPLPSHLRYGVLQGKEHLLRQYDIATAFTVEPENYSPANAPAPVRGLMTTFGYILPHPSVPNRFYVWFTGGLLEEVVSKDHITRPSAEWRRIFHHSPGRSLKSRAQLVAARLLLGAHVPDRMDETDGSMEYFFHRPIGGNGSQYIDVLYLDEDFRVTRGHHGTIYVSARMNNGQMRI